MNSYIYRGTVIHETGQKTIVVLKEGKSHWIDSDRGRWRNKDGTRGGAEPGVRWPRLVLSTIHIAPGKSPNNSRRLTHEGNVVVFAAGGKGALCRLRESKHYWIDSDGRKFRKLDGWQTPKPTHRLLLDSIAETKMGQRIALPKTK